ncbi:MAG: DUF1080 domain-containing protein [Planctomycetaceae bacterium]|nr:DUF1080 domain-containing protein [Planctomycetaceae bacterium]
MKSLFYSFVSFVLFTFLLSPAQAAVFPLRHPGTPCSAEVSPVFHRATPQYPAEYRQWTVGPAVSLLQPDSLAGWTSTSGKAPPEAWSVQDGVLHLKGKGGDIMTEREYENFILEFSWTISKGGNSGIKYRFKNYDGKGWLGLEYQVLDDFNVLSGEGARPKNNAATLYYIVSTDVSKKRLNPHDVINYGKVVVRGQHIEHYLNGEKVLEITAGSERWFEAVAESKFKDVPDFGLNQAGRIMVQDHNSEVWFHSLTIRELYPVSSAPHRRSLPYFSESRDTFPAAQVCAGFPNVNSDRYFGHFPVSSVKMPVCATPYTTPYCVPKCTPRYRCILRNFFNR